MPEDTGSGSAHSVATVLPGSLSSTDAGAKTKGASGASSGASKPGGAAPPNRGSRRAGGKGGEPKHGDNFKPGARAPKAGKGDNRTGNGFRKADTKAMGRGLNSEEGRSRTTSRDVKAEAGPAKPTGANLEVLGGGSAAVSAVVPETDSTTKSSTLKSLSDMHKARANTSMISGGGGGMAKASSSALKAKRSISKVGGEGINPSVGGLKAGRKSLKIGSGTLEGLKGIPPGLQKASKGGGGDCKTGGQDSKSGSRRLSKGGGSGSRASEGIPKVGGGGFAKAHVFGKATIGPETSSCFESRLGSFGSGQADTGDAKEVGFLAKGSKKVRTGPTLREEIDIRQKEQREKVEKAEQARKEKALKQAQAAREKLEKEERIRQEKEEEKTRKIKEKQEKAKKLQDEKAKLFAERQAERRAAMEQRQEKQVWWTVLSLLRNQSRGVARIPL